MSTFTLTCVVVDHQIKINVKQDFLLIDILTTRPNIYFDAYLCYCFWRVEAIPKWRKKIFLNNFFKCDMPF